MRRGRREGIQPLAASAQRVPIKQIAKHVGFPSNFVEAWHRFLVGFSRRFCVHDTVGGPLFSNCGYPEGCPLSCLAMALVDWCYHLYQSHFSPRATSASFVDNLEIVANHPGALLHAVVTQDAFLEMFQLRIDLDKTYLWAVHPQHRQQLQLMGRRMSLKDKDLGGQMTYGARRRTAHHPDILAGLQPTWTLLKKLNVPTFNKHLVLYQALWPRVFHSAPIEDFSTANIKSLRTAAVRATGAGRAGASPRIRLSLLSGNILCDPGFFQLWQVVRTFRRILHKQASLIDTWAEFTASYDGRAFAGPFTVLLRQLNAITWKIASPPTLVDHEGHHHNIMTIDIGLLRLLLEDAWLQSTSRDLVQRQTTRAYKESTG